jgi:hypothetical protein
MNSRDVWPEPSCSTRGPGNRFMGQRRNIPPVKSLLILHYLTPSRVCGRTASPFAIIRSLTEPKSAPLNVELAVTTH